MTTDLVFTIALSALLILSGAIALWILPWSDTDVAETTRALGSLPRTAARGAFRWAARLWLAPQRMERIRMAQVALVSRVGAPEQARSA